MSEKFEIDGYSAEELLIGVAVQRYASMLQQQACPKFGLNEEAIAKEEAWLADNPSVNFYPQAIARLKKNVDHLRSLSRPQPDA